MFIVLKYESLQVHWSVITPSYHETRILCVTGVDWPQ